MNFWLTLIISAVSDFVIVAGGALMTAMVAAGSQQMPSTTAFLFAWVTGVVAAARRVEALMRTPPIKSEPEKPSTEGATP